MTDGRTDWLMIDEHDRDGRRGMYGPGKHSAMLFLFLLVHFLA